MDDIKMIACGKLERQLKLIGCDYIIRRPDGTIVSDGEVSDLKPKPKHGALRNYVRKYLTDMKPGETRHVPYSDEFDRKAVVKSVSSEAFAVFGKGNFATRHDERGAVVMSLAVGDE